MAPTSVGIVAAAKAMQDEKLCDKVKISGLGVPSEMLAYTKNGCAPEFALWSFVDLGYLTYYTAYALATGAIKAEEAGKASRPAAWANTPSPRTRPAKAGLRILMGPFSIYDKDNVEAGGEVAICKTALTPTLSRKRERGACPFSRFAGEGGASAG